jgi:hypothetical protein
MLLSYSSCITSYYRSVVFLYEPSGLAAHTQTEYRKQFGGCNMPARSTVLTGCHYKNCALQGYYATSRGNLLPMFQDNQLVPSSGIKNPKESLLSQYRDQNERAPPLRMAWTSRQIGVGRT